MDWMEDSPPGRTFFWSARGWVWSNHYMKSHRGRRIQLVVALAQSDMQDPVLAVMAVVASGLAAAVLAWRP